MLNMLSSCTKFWVLVLEIQNILKVLSNFIVYWVFRSYRKSIL